MIEKILQKLKTEHVFERNINNIPKSKRVIRCDVSDQKIRDARSWLKAYREKKKDSFLDQSLITIASIAGFKTDLNNTDIRILIRNTMINLFSEETDLEVLFKQHKYEITYGYGSTICGSLPVTIDSYEIKNDRGYNLTFYVYAKSDYNILSSIANTLGKEQFHQYVDDHKLTYEYSRRCGVL